MYLPIHKRMEKEVKEGHFVVHNGGGKRQGFIGRVMGINSRTVYVKFDKISIVQDYSVEWFLDNFYIQTSDILCMDKLFNGDDYINKYKEFSLRAFELLTRKPAHKSIKSAVDLENVITEHIVEAPSIDPLDAAGDYYIVNSKNLKNHGTAKTQRLANRQAASLAEKYCGDFLVLKKVSETEAVRTINIKNI